MRSKVMIIAGAVVLSTLSMNVVAAEATYTLDYAASSPIKDVSLKNAALKIEVYKNDNPSGYQDVTTDANQTFKLDSNYDLEVVSVQDQDKHNANCSGSATSTNPKIMITCTPKHNAANPTTTDEIED